VSLILGHGLEAIGLRKPPPSVMILLPNSVADTQTASDCPLIFAVLYFFQKILKFVPNFSNSLTKQTNFSLSVFFVLDKQNT